MLNRKQLKRIKAATGGDPELLKQVLAKAGQAANDPSIRKIAKKMATGKNKKKLDINKIKDSVLNDGDMLNRMGLPARPANFPSAPPEAEELFRSMASGSGNNETSKPVKKLEPCVVCKTPGSSKCGNCKITFYCSKKCLKLDKKKHKKLCAKLANEYYANLDREEKEKFEVMTKFKEIEEREEKKEREERGKEDEDSNKSDDEDEEEMLKALSGGIGDDVELVGNESDDDELMDMMK